MNQYAGDLHQSISNTMQSEDVKSNGRRSKYECFLQAMNYMNKKCKVNKLQPQLKTKNKLFQYVKSQSQLPTSKASSIIYYESGSFPSISENENSEFSRTMVHCSREDEFVNKILII